MFGRGIYHNGNPNFLLAQQPFIGIYTWFVRRKKKINVDKTGFVIVLFNKQFVLQGEVLIFLKNNSTG